MASKWYPIGVKAALKGDVALDGSLKVMLVNTGYSYSTAHDFLADVSASRIGTDIAAAGEDVTVADNVAKFDCDDTGLTWSAVAAGSTVIGIITYVDTGNEATSYLLTYNEVTSTPTNGGDITITINASGLGTITC